MKLQVRRVNNIGCDNELFVYDYLVAWVDAKGGRDDLRAWWKYKVEATLWDELKYIEWSRGPDPSARQQYTRKAYPVAAQIVGTYVNVGTSMVDYANPKASDYLQYGGEILIHMKIVLGNQHVGDELDNVGLIIGEILGDELDDLLGHESFRSRVLTLLNKPSSMVINVVK